MLICETSLPNSTSLRGGSFHASLRYYGTRQAPVQAVHVQYPRHEARLLWTEMSYGGPTGDQYDSVYSKAMQLAMELFVLLCQTPSRNLCTVHLPVAVVR